MAKDAEQDWRQEAKERLKEKQSKGRFKLQEGENTIRILPRVGSKKSQAPFFEYMVHREVGPNKRFVRCGRNVHGDGDCWLCDEKIPALANSGDSAKEKRASALTSKEQFVVQVATIDSDTGKMHGPFLWTVPTGGARSLAARLLGVLKSTKRDYIHPAKGYNLTIERTGTGKNDTLYGQIVADEDSSKVSEKILNGAKPFSQLIPAYSEEQQKAAYFGRDAQEEAEEEEETKARRGGMTEDDESGTETEEEEEAPKSKKKKQADEDEEEPAEEPEEEEDERPAKKGKKKSEEEEEEPEPEEEEEPAPKKKKKPVDDEEEEPEPEEEEEPEPAPKKKKKVVADEDEEPEPEEESGDDDEEERPKSKKAKRSSEEEEEEEPAPKKKAKRRSDDDDE